MTPEKLKILQDHVRDWEEKGVIEVCKNTGWSNPIFLVKKAGVNKYRPVLDFRAVNKVCSVSASPLNKIAHVLTQLRPSYVLSKIDLESAFLSMNLEKSSRDLTAFYVPGMGRYRFTRGFFGASAMPSYFCAKIAKILERFKNNLQVFLDDILLYTSSISEMILLIQAVLETLQDHQVQVNWEKSVFCREYVTFLGMLVGQNEVQVHHETIVEVLATARPSSRKKLHSFLAKISYFRVHLPDLGTRVYPLQKMLRKNSTFAWTSETARCWDELLKFLASPDVLTVPDWQLPYRLYVYSNPGCSVSAVLTQEMEGKEKTISHFSHVLSPSESRYDEKLVDCLGVVLSLERFQYFLRGSSCEVVSQRSGLEWLQSIKQPRSMLQRWLLRISQFNITSHDLAEPVSNFSPAPVPVADDFSNSLLSELQRNHVMQTVLEIRDMNRLASGRVISCPFTITISNPEKGPTQERFADLNPKQLTQARDALDRLVAEGQLQPGVGAWSRSCVPVVEQGKVQIQIDHRPLDLRTVAIQEIQPWSLEKRIEALKAPFVSLLNFELGENLLPIFDTSSRELSALVVEKAGLFESLWVDQSWLNHRSFLNNHIVDSLSSVPGCFLSCGFIYVYSCNVEEHCRTLKIIFEILGRLAIRINLDRSHFLPGHFSAFGRIYERDGVVVSPHKRVIDRWCSPATEEEAKSLVRAAKLIGEGSAQETRLRELLVPALLLGPSGDTICQEIKELLKEIPLHLPQEEETVFLSADASSKGWGAMAYVYEQGRMKIVDMIAGELPKTVQFGSATSIEAFSALTTVHHFDYLIKPGKTTLRTDHQALTFWNRFKGHSNGGQTAAKISRSGVTVTYIKGKDNIIPDLLSRNPFAWTNRQHVESQVDQSMAEIGELTLLPGVGSEVSDLVATFENSKCPWYQKMRADVEKHPRKFPHFLLDEKRRLWKNIKNKSTSIVRQVMVVPTDCREKLVEAYHSEAHWGREKTLQRILERFYWAGAGVLVRKHVRTCLTCQSVKKTTSDLSAGQMEIHVPKEISPGACWYLDFVGPLVPDSGMKYILVATCSTTNWVYAVPTRRATAKSVVNLIEKEILPVTGRVDLVVTDNARQFCNTELAEYLAKRRIAHHLIPVYSAFTNKTERINGNLKRLLRTLVSKHNQWVSKLPMIVFALRTAKIVPTKFSPAELFLGYSPKPWWREQSDILNGEAILPETEERVKVASQKREKMYQAALKSIEEYRRKQQEKYNRTHKETLYHVGQLVWLKRLGQKSSKEKGISASLYSPWRGIFRVAKVHSKTQYELETLLGAKAGRHHVIHMKTANLPPSVTEKDLLDTRWCGTAGQDAEQADEGDKVEEEVTHHKYNLRSRRPAPVP